MKCFLKFLRILKNTICPKQKGERIYCEECDYKCWTKLILGVIEKHLGMNLLGKEDAWDNLIRVKDGKAASELLIMAHEVTKEV